MGSFESGKYKTDKKIINKGESMKRTKTLLLIALMALSISFMLVSNSFAQISDANYDDWDYETPIVTVATEEKMSEVARIFDVIRKIQNGEPTVLQLIVYKNLLQVDDVVKLIIFEDREPNRYKKFKSLVLTDEQIGWIKRELNSNSEEIESLKKQNYYAVMGGKVGLNSFIGGMKNQDPKVRLKCIGYMGDYVDELPEGPEFTTILSAVRSRLNSGVETRDEVEWALRLLQYKIIRKQTLKKIYNGDENVLATISPDDFLVLVSSERVIAKRFFETLYKKMKDSNIVVRSIRLDPYAPCPVPGTLIPEKYENDKSIQKIDADHLRRLNEYYFRYENVKAYKAILAGLQNKHLVVREKCAQLLLDIYFVAVREAETFAGVAGQHPFNNAATTQEQKDGLQPIRPINSDGEALNQIASSAKYKNILLKTWEEVKYATFNRVDDEEATHHPKQFVSKDEVDGVENGGYGLLPLLGQNSSPSRGDRPADLTPIIYFGNDLSNDEIDYFDEYVAGSSPDTQPNWNNEYQPREVATDTLGRNVQLRRTQRLKILLGFSDEIGTASPNYTDAGGATVQVPNVGGYGTISANAIASDRAGDSSTTFGNTLIDLQAGASNVNDNIKGCYAVEPNYRLHIADLLYKIGEGEVLGKVRKEEVEEVVEQTTGIKRYYVESLFNNQGKGMILEDEVPTRHDQLFGEK